MSAPKITARFRLKDKVPFSIETFSGRIYRCGYCGKILYSRDELDKHISVEKDSGNDKTMFPELNKNLTISLIYTQNIKDLTNSKYPKLQKGDKLLKRISKK
jgi:hypothetical protein